MASLNERCSASPSAQLKMDLAQDNVRQLYPQDRFPVLACGAQTTAILSCPGRVEAWDLPHPTGQMKGVIHWSNKGSKRKAQG